MFSGRKLKALTLPRPENPSRTEPPSQLTFETTQTHCSVSFPGQSSIEDNLDQPWVGFRSSDTGLHTPDPRRGLPDSSRLGHLTPGLHPATTNRGRLTSAMGDWSQHTASSEVQRPVVLFLASHHTPSRLVLYLPIVGDREGLNPSWRERPRHKGRIEGAAKGPPKPVT